ncbi:unnamed protein product [Didymodactylos carnosus]|uniref:Uncharacterized protein n=1 Tax=Didymodactylos carnosus TaxID=1234261 RepID=A0A813WJC9_9BILA|nr:unnamed protein product [Didymodactylos carnosus]CAF1161116.1 unnamed protein product [Didymodactylos carnosus]CAF3644517.1 unnamed protein product [Didymodactylos carnosus]CAF3972856.1 unnamed protein product [Didymodactylos carnosus]
MISCRYVFNLSVIENYLSQHSEISAIEFIDSTINFSPINTFNSSVFKHYDFLIIHKTKFILNENVKCPIDAFENLFYLHIADCSTDSFDKFFAQCSIMQRLHILLLDRTYWGNEQVFIRQFPNLHMFRLSFTIISHPINGSFIQSFSHLNDFALAVNDDCHRCDYDWIKYLARNISLNKVDQLHISTKSGCMDWSINKFLSWKNAPLCGTCSLRYNVNSTICPLEDGITEHYCKGYYGHRAIFEQWNQLSISKTTIKPTTFYTQPQHERLAIMKPSFTFTTQPLTTTTIIEHITKSYAPKRVTRQNKFTTTVVRKTHNRC